MPENIHTTHMEGICHMTPPSPRNFHNFWTPLEILLSLIEVNKEVVLFTRMPNFVSFMYFLLNCITGKQIPYANSLWTKVTDKFCAFHVISVEFYDSANKMQGRVGNITVLFSHCVKKKASLEEIRTSWRDKTVWVSNFVLRNLRIWVCRKIVRHW